MRSLLAAICATVLLGGCAAMPDSESWKIPNPLSRKEKVPEPYPTPVKMAVTWAPDTLSSPGKTTTRGFGGRFFFYNEKSQAVPVDGELLVVGYLDTGIEGAPPITRRFAFTPEQLTSHFSQSDLGASYSVWIPWDAEGGMQHIVTLVPTFQPKDAGKFQGAPTVVVLPGKTGMEGQGQRPRSRQILSPNSGGNLAQGVRQAGFAPGSASGTPGNPRSGLTTTTIPMDGHMTRRLNRR